MKPKIIFLIRGNPVEDARVAEAVRMAAGLGTGQNSVKIILSGAALHLMSPNADDLADQDIIEKFLPVLGEWKIPFYAKRKELEGGISISPEYQVQAVDEDELAELMAGGHTFFVF
ncbi:MAG: hypothetical protein HZA19_06640 [Nitrospirae bacterium]|nr:hypothetical protein [Nitrospirota bacterium]